MSLEKTAMETLNVSMPREMKKYVQKRVASGGYGNTSEYVRDLIRAEQKARAKAELEALLLEGINSGPATEMTKEDWERLRERVRQRAKKTASR
jgi:antitoxin ParD1/3/4